MRRFDLVFKMNRLLFLFTLYFSILKHCYCSCKFEKPCQCVFTNGSIVDLSSLGNQNNKARFENVHAEIKENYTYFYNPCFSFSLGNGDCKKGVAACQVSKFNKSLSFDIGDTESAQAVIDSNKLVLLYSGVARYTNVTFICSEDALEPVFKVIGEKKTSHYVMTLESRCACPDLCLISHLSTGSVLVIIFMIFLSLYLVLGIIHSSLTRGAHGWELLPHYEFWADFPLLVRDGCVFVVNGCKPEPAAYERI